MIDTHMTRPAARLCAAFAALLALPCLSTPARGDAPLFKEDVPDVGVAAAVPWRWDPPGAEADQWRRAFETSPPKPRLAGPDGSTLVFVVRGHKPHVRKLNARGVVAWDRALGGIEGNAVFVLEGDTLYAALFHGGAPGCRVVALRATSGARLWETDLHAVGPTGHSAYASRVQMRLAPEGLVIYGNEFKGRYIEILRAADGRRIGYRFLPW